MSEAQARRDGPARFSTPSVAARPDFHKSGQYRAWERRPGRATVRMAAGEVVASVATPQATRGSIAVDKWVDPEEDN